MRPRLLLSLIFLLSASISWAQSGAIRGKIVDQSKKQALPGASVIMGAREGGVATDLDGFFTLSGLKPGDYKLTFSYIGFTDIEKAVTVEAGKTTFITVELESGVFLNEGVVVTASTKESQAKALNSQKNNMNITNMVSSDQVGRFPDANIGDAMKRIPGITMQYDQGEARFGLIRGTAPQLNSVMINGERVPSAEGETRSVQLDLIPSDMIQSIEVSKALTPDMDADAIGGATNLKTKSAPTGLRISATGAGGYNGLTKEANYTGGVVVGNRFFSDKLGVIFSTSYNNNTFGSDNIEAEWDKEDDGTIFLDEMDVRKYRLTRERQSYSLNLDYNINNNHSLFLNTMHNQRKDWENRYRVRYKKMGVTDANGITEGNIEIQTKGGIDNDKVKNARLEDQRTSFALLGGKHFIANKLEMNWSVSLAKASEERPNERYIQYRVKGTDLKVDVSNPEKPAVSPVNEFGDYSGLELDEILEENQYTEEIDKNARIDFKLPIGSVGFVKFGGRLRMKEKLRDNAYIEYGDETDALKTMNLASLEDQSEDKFLAGEKYNSGKFVTKEFLGALDLYNPSKFEAEDKPEEYLPANYEADENIYAAYGMASFNIGKFTLLGGLRLEQTVVDYIGNQYVVDENGDPLTPKVTVGSNTTNNLLPSFHTKFNATPNTILRFAYTTTLARPNYYDIVPYHFENKEDREIEVGNPDLEIMTSNNLDLMVEHYYKNIGLISGGVFYKRINDFIYEQTIDDVDIYNDPNNLYELKKSYNGGNADIIGFEVAYQRQLDFLPGFLKGFGVYANYSYTASKAKGFAQRDGKSLDLPGTVPHAANFSLSYELNKITARLSMNYTSDYIDELGDEEFKDSFYDEQFFLDFNASYSFNDNLRLFVEMNNLTNQPLRYYQGTQERTMQEEYYSYRMNFGIKYDLF